MEDNNRGFTLVETLILTTISVIIIAATTSSLIMSQKTAVNVSDRMELIREGDILERYLKRDINSAQKIEIPNDSTLRIKSDGDTKINYEFKSNKKIIKYTREEAGVLKRKISFPMNKAKILKAKFEFLSQDNGVIKLTADLVKKTSSKKKDNILQRKLETIIKARAIGLNN